MQERAAFSAGLYGVAHCAVILALAVRPTRYRWLLFLPAASIYLYLPFKTTTGDATTDLGIGSALICQLLFAADYILVTEVQRELRLVAQTRPITSSGFFERLRWAINLFFSPRGIGWMHAPSVIPRPPQSTSRSLFVRNRIVEGILCVFFELTVYFMNVTNPAMIDVEKGSSRQYGLYYQAMGVLGFALAGYARINVLFCVTSVAAVVFGLSEPKDWPDLFGSIWEAYSVRRFWSRTWHQLLRRPISTATGFIVNKVLRYPRGTMVSSIVWFYTAFLVSGLAHSAGEYMMLRRPGTSTLLFFSLQAVAISFETCVAAFFGDSMPREPSRLLRLLGYAWVLSWFVWSLPFMVDPTIKAGIYLDTRGFTFDRVLEYVEHKARW